MAVVSRGSRYFVWFIAVCHHKCTVPFFKQLLTLKPGRFGYDSAFIGTTIARDSFKRDFNITGDEANSISSNITSAFQAGAFFGAIFCFLITERVGRKWALEVSSVIFVVGAVLMTAATSQLSYICEFGPVPILSPRRPNSHLTLISYGIAHLQSLLCHLAHTSPSRFCLMPPPEADKE